MQGIAASQPHLSTFQCHPLFFFSGSQVVIA
jgi:hypothetical protein